LRNAQEILKDIGINMDIVTLDIPKKDVKGFLQKIKKLSIGYNPYKAVKIIRNILRWQSRLMNWRG
jgi:hypothetical protein